VKKRDQRATLSPPLEAIVEAMKNFPEIVSLQAQLSSVPNLTREACIAEVTVGQGRLHSCAITTPTAVPPPQKGGIHHQYNSMGIWSGASTPRHPSPCRRDHLHGK